MNKGFKQLGITLLGVIMIAVIAAACTPKKSADQLAMEAKILELQLALQGLSADDTDDETDDDAEDARRERRQRREERRERRAALQAELEAAETQLETVAVTPPATSTTKPPATTPPAAQQQPSGGNIVGTWHDTYPTSVGTSTDIWVYNSNGTCMMAYRNDSTGEISKGPFPYTWSVSGNKLTRVRAFDQIGPAALTYTYNISGNTLTTTGDYTSDVYTRGEPPKVEVTSPQPTAQEQIARQKLVGTWRLRPPPYDGVNHEIYTFNADGTWRKTTTTNGVIYTFNADGTGTYDLTGSSVNITWTVGGGRLKVINHARSGDVTDYFRYSFDDDNLLVFYPASAGSGITLDRQ
jgi:hypothetical protein